MLVVGTELFVHPRDATGYVPTSELQPTVPGFHVGFVCNGHDTCTDGLAGSGQGYCITGWGGEE